MIEEDISDPFQVLGHFVDEARAGNASSLRIQANIANDRLYAALVKRYGLITIGGMDYINIPIDK